MKRFIFTTLAVCVCAAVTASAQFPNPLKKKDDKTAKETKNDAKNEARYQQIKQYGQDKYRNDEDFRDEVDQRFEDLMREHSERAYEKNTGRGSRMMMVHEDNWRVHSRLYDNLRVQDLINRIGQRVVPERSERLFAFKVTPDPIPSAETLSTGTIYISTGMISMLDNEAQLAYILAHEMAHVELEHWKERVLLDVADEEMSAEKAQRTRRLAMITGIAGAGLGAALGKNAMDAAAGGMLGAAAGALTGMMLNRPLVVNWQRVEEDQADELAFRQMLAANYDVREIPGLYTAFERTVVRDSRVGLGFLGSRRRIAQRTEKAKDLIENAYKADIELKLKNGVLKGDSPSYRNVMAELKRDNGIMAYYNDMYELARKNLKEAADVRSNDPAVHYFHGKVLRLVGRTPEDAKLAIAAFRKAKDTDYRKQNYGANLHHALVLMEGEDFANSKEEISKELDAYVTNYARWNAEMFNSRLFPPNLDAIYEYNRLYGDPGWRPKAPDLTDMPNFERYYARYSPEGPWHDAPPAREPKAQEKPATNEPSTMQAIQNAVIPATVRRTKVGTAAAIANTAGQVVQQKTSPAKSK